ncbi:nucleotidyl transferase AbiEii/AbiGii toxin family protein [Mycoplasma sp. NEAQ87857]|uniref:nucleotidyl transferase AbiEii/AbiGii toxin family protein n=1 Tax=Mycoplasma sp. NEAQ87857 TaxID=2683967 RepID=UPI00131DA44C|nr:nucleotidyl transferase AbiEii/AbiGii toxin family protein [Mycoplasma sp. NEAQ87857]
MFFFERFLERVSKTEYANNFIIKGGFLISSFSNIAQRTTMDLDASIEYLDFEKSNVEKIIKEISEAKIDDGVEFEFRNIGYIRDNSFYGGFRISLLAKLDKVNNVIKMDISTGDKITPKEQLIAYKCIFEDKSIGVQAYPIETVLAEKIDAIFYWLEGTTRMRDYYDIYLLYSCKKDEINFDILKQAIINTSAQRNNFEYIKDSRQGLERIKNPKYNMKEKWLKYQITNPYTKSVNFDDVIKTLELFIDKLGF